MKNNPLVSIITVVYNGAATIERTIQSVINQTYKNIEYIIIDGCSTDGTQDIVRSYKDKISYFISEKDSGIYDAMNKGIRKAQGDIIGIINSDDWYDVHAAEQAVNAFMGDQDVGLVYGNVFYMEGNKKKKLYIPDRINTIWHKMTVPHPTVFVKKSIYDRYGIFDTGYKIAADYEFVLRLYTNGVRLKYINYAMAYFSFGGISQSLAADCRMETEKIICAYMDLCDEGAEMSEILEWKKRHFVFSNILQRTPEKIEQKLNDYFKSEQLEIIIFGAGEWGRLCCQALSRTNIDVKFFVDNNITGELFDKEIVSPNSLKNSDNVLIAVQNDAEAIEAQLEEAGIEKYISIKKLIDMYLL